MAHRKLTDSERLLPLTREYLRDVINYDELTGFFTWRKGMSSSAMPGCVAGNTSHKRGYRRIRINSKNYLAHRLVWFYVHGEWPPNEIDHINGSTDDNRICNLRLATRGQNQQNIRCANRNNKSCGLQGVTWHKKNKKWQARIRHLGKTIRLGYFKSAHEAHKKYVEAKRKIHEFCTI